MTVAYLDPDDEITDAIGRLRATDDRRFILVLPAGSRIATSRINFRLLARESQERGVTVGLVSGEAGVRSLAISAGIPAYGSVAEAEASLPSADAGDVPAAATAGTTERPSTATTPATPAEPMAAQARRTAATAAASSAADAAAIPPPPPPPTTGSSVRSGAPLRPSSAVRTETEATRVLPRSSVSGATPYAGVPAVSTSPPPGWETDGWSTGTTRSGRGRGRSSGRRLTGLLVRVGVVVAVLAVALYVAYLTLPNVAVSVAPTTTVAGPVSVDVIADPSVSTVDPLAGVVPAEIIDIPLSATDDFTATGTRTEEIRATGRVVLSSENTVSVVVVVEGTRLSTAAGIDFETTEDVTVPEADFDSRTPGRAGVRVRAVRPGPGGNVDAGTITRLPGEYADQKVEVTNPDPTTGGARHEVTVVTRSDYDDAVAALDIVLDEQLAAALSDPATIPQGLVAYPATAERDRATTDPMAGDLVDQAVETFTLSAESLGTVVAVDETLITDLAAERLAGSVPEDTVLYPDTVTVELGEGTVTDGRIAFTATATGQQYAPLDQGAMVESIRGRSISEARVILGRHGTVVITPWPDFIGTVPDDPRRITLTILEPQRSNP